LLKRAFSKELTSLLRDSFHNHSFPDIDEFTSTLTNEIEQMVTAPIPVCDVRTGILTQKIINVIQEQTKPMTTAWVEAEGRRVSLVARHRRALQALRKELELLKVELKSKNDHAIHELDRERIAAIRSQERNQTQETKLASLRLFRTELEARERHQKAEKENVERSLQQQAVKKQEWEENLENGGTEDGSISRHLREIVRLMRSEIQDNGTEKPFGSVEEAIRLLNKEADDMRMQMAELDAMSRMITVPRVVQVSVNPKPRQESALIIEAQAKVNQIRRSRELNRR
jgi:hypothetical protein